MIQTKNYLLKPLVSDDLGPEYFGWLKDEEVTRHLFVHGTPLEEVEIKQHVDSYDRENDFFWGIFTNTNKMIGTHSYAFSPQHKRCSMGVMIGDKSYWGKNVVVEIRTAILDFAFYSQGCVKAEAGCYKNNIAAIYNFQRLGWKKEGVKRSHRQIDGEREDLILFGILKEEWDGRV